LQIAGDLTIEMWINVPLTARQTLISKDYLREFELTLETSGHLNLYQGNGSVFEHVVSVASAIAPNVWQHVVVTREAATKTVRFYVNGGPRGRGTSALARAAGTKPVYSGRTGTGGGIQYVNGLVDEVAVYPTPISAGQAAAHYAVR